MIKVALFTNLIAMLFTGIAAGMNFNSRNTVTGLAMIALFIVNTGCFIINLGRLVG